MRTTTEQFLEYIQNGLIQVIEFNESFEEGDDIVVDCKVLFYQPLESITIAIKIEGDKYNG